MDAPLPTDFVLTLIQITDQSVMEQENVTFEWYVFRKNSPRDSLDIILGAPLPDLKTKACEVSVSLADGMLKDQIIFGIRDFFPRTVSTRKEKLPPSKCIEMCKTAGRPAV